MKRGNLILYLMLLALGLSGACYYYISAAGPGSVIVILVEGEVAATYPLFETGRDEFVDIQGVNGITRVQLQDGRVRVVESACPDKVCVNTGWISNSARPIACLPNRVVVKIIHQGTQDIDIR